MKNTQNILSMILAFLPEAEQIASIFIHNPESQHQFQLVVGTVNTLTPVVSGLTAALAAQSAAAAPAAATAAAEIPAGVPSFHPAS